MTITFTIPENVERLLQEQGPDANLAAKEAALVELYRQDKITHFELAQALGLSRYQTDGVLKRHGVTEDLPTVEEFEQQLEQPLDPAGSQ